MTTTKARPIIMSAHSVRAILAGRKGQSRRVIKPQPWADHLGYMITSPGVATLCGPDYPDGDEDDVRCPYGQVGDVLWVKETWMPRALDLPISEILKPRYRADEGEDRPSWRGLWRSPLFMPRKFCRLYLRITGVRVERVQEISEADALAEGVPWEAYQSGTIDRSWCPKCKGLAVYQAFGENLGVTEADCLECDTPVKLFRNQWDQLNGKRAPWASNPWVWVITFERTEAAL